VGFTRENPTSYFTSKRALRKRNESLTAVGIVRTGRGLSLIVGNLIIPS